MAKKKRKPIKPIKNKKSTSLRQRKQQKKTKAVVKKTSKATSKKVKPTSLRQRKQQKKVPVAIPSNPKLTKAQLEKLKEIMEYKNRPSDSKQAIYDFYNEYRETFDNYFDSSGLQFSKGSDNIIDDIDNAKKGGSIFYLNGKRISADRLKYQISLTEFNIQAHHDATGVQFSYSLNNKGEFKMDLPSISDIKDFEDAEAEVLIDAYSEVYGIFIYLSEPNTKKAKQKHEQYQDEYRKRINKRKRETKIKNKKVKRKGNK